MKKTKECDLYKLAWKEAQLLYTLGKSCPLRIWAIGR
jgi:hypothetical protein